MASDTHPAPTSEELAEYRTVLAAERTLFAGLRTGLAIAAGGSLVSSLLGDQWPAWVRVALVAAFLGVGYALTLMGLSRYRRALQAFQDRAPMGHRPTSPRLLTIGLVVLQVAIVIVVVLFLLENI